MTPVEIAVSVPAFLLGCLTVLAHDRWRRAQAARPPRRLRRPGYYQCAGACSYRFRHDGRGQWKGPYGANMSPYVMTWEELEDSYGDCTRSLALITDPERIYS